MMVVKVPEVAQWQKNMKVSAKGPSYLVLND